MKGCDQAIINSYFAPEGGIIELGPAISHHTFDQERMGGQLSKFATSYKNPIATIKNHYLLCKVR
jgi:hypothetical protein